jgi:hypothetical protein
VDRSQKIAVELASIRLDWSYMVADEKEEKKTIHCHGW